MIQLLFFSYLQEQVGTNSIIMTNYPRQIDELLQTIQSNYNTGTLDSTLVAVNESFVPKDYVLRDGDVVAFIPPVSGG